MVLAVLVVVAVALMVVVAVLAQSPRLYKPIYDSFSQFMCLRCSHNSCLALMNLPVPAFALP